MNNQTYSLSIVPQGSIPGPLLFLMILNNMKAITNFVRDSEVVLHADYSSIIKRN